MVSMLEICGSLQQFGKGAGIGWEDCGAHHFHSFPASRCETELIGDERVVLNLEDLRKPAQGMVSMSPLLAAKHLTWVPEESAVHEQFCEGVVQNGTVDLHIFPQVISSSELPQRSLREMWGVPNPDLKSTLSLDGFCMSRRFTCQAIRDHQAKSRALTRWPIGGCIIEGAASTQKNGPRSAIECLSVEFFEQLGVNAEPPLQVAPCRRVQIHEKVSWQKRSATMGKIGPEAWVQGSCLES